MSGMLREHAGAFVSSLRVSNDFAGCNLRLSSRRRLMTRRRRVLILSGFLFANSTIRCTSGSKARSSDLSNGSPPGLDQVPLEGIRHVAIALGGSLPTVGPSQQSKLGQRIGAASAMVRNPELGRIPIRRG